MYIKFQYIVLTLVLIFFSFTALAGEKIMYNTTVNDRGWIKLPGGRQISPLFGDMKKGHHITFIKFASGVKTPPHTHTNDYVGIVVSGTARHYQEGNADSKIPLSAGSTWFVPGNVVHISECISKNECVFAIHQDSKFDRFMVK